MASWSAESERNRRAGQQRIRRKCTCGRIITGNPAWWSHTHLQDGTERDGHRYAGRA